MLKRKALTNLEQWKKHSKGKTALLIEGARRVGKTTLAKTFAKQAYKSYIEINFDQVSNEMKTLFLENASDLDRLFQYLSVYYNVPLFSGDTLFIFDEIQQFPFARGLLKHLVADGRYDFIETGSLLSIKQNVQDIVIPSEEKPFRLNPLDFEEFLWALNEDLLVDALQQSFEELCPLPEALHRKATKLFREYMLVGGMPKPLQAFVTQNDFQKADQEKRLILNLYRNDISRFAAGYEHKVISIFDQIPAQLSKHEKRFTLSSLEKNARMRSYEEAFFWLGDSFVANLCYASNDPNVGLSLNLENSAVKCYMADTGLLTTMVLADEENTQNDIYKSVLLGDVGLNQGMLTENAVAQALVANGKKLFFYNQSGRKEGQERLEIDFLIRTRYANASDKPRISPVEVKSQRQFGTASLDKLKKAYSKRIGTQYIVSPKPFKKEGDRVQLPLYMVHLL